MDEYDGVLRVAVGPDPADRQLQLGRHPRARTATTWSRSAGSDRLGRRTRRSESVRWFDGLAIMVTFRQVDPLYAVDLTDPADPRLLGELKIPGFSEYLHPLGAHRLIGIGQDAARDGRLGRPGRRSSTSPT